MNKKARSIAIRKAKGPKEYGGGKGLGVSDYESLSSTSVSKIKAKQKLEDKDNNE